ncbi:class C sortase [Arcanobacterium phocisimile]|nr:class C sortase [Arcanobacterium phocisimile]
MGKVRMHRNIVFAEKSEGRDVGLPEPEIAKNKKASGGFLMPTIIILIGVSILLYPIVSTQWNNYQQRLVADEYASFVEKQDTSKLEESLEKAYSYNQNRTVGPILDPWTARLSDDNEPYSEYLEQLNLMGTMARIVIPSIKVDLPVFHGTRPETLERGVGHLFGTDLPVGGEGTHSVLTSHTGLQTATLFDNLKDISTGDSIYIDVYGEKLRYVVTGTEVVLPDEADTLYKVEGKDLLTLVTCTPYGINSHRLLVHAERAPMDDNGADAVENGVGWEIQWWMWLFGIAALSAVLILIRFLYVSKNNHNQ